MGISWTLSGSKTTNYNVKGRKYMLVHDRMCNQGGWQLRCFRWFLSEWFDNHWEYLGDFTRKRDVEKFISF